MDNQMDNQQITHDRIVWLAGIIDGEGTINITRKAVGKNIDGTKKFRYWTTIQITNTNEELITRVIDILRLLGSNPYVWEKKATERWKKAYQVYLQNMNKVYRVLIPLTPYLVAKRRQAELVVKFIESRVSRHENNRGRVAHLPYWEEEIEMINEIRRLNHRGNLRDFMSESVFINTDKIKSTS